MARMYSRKHGKAGSKKPLMKTKKTWVRYGKKEIELLIPKLAKAGNNSAKIGIVLRDMYGIPDIKQIIGRSVSDVLKENKLEAEIPDDLMSLMRRSILIKKHLENNRQDEVATRGLHLTESKIRKLAKYYKKSGRLPIDWKFSPEKVKLYVA